jgi:bifunctional non-homologous end joining protein LigD
MVRIEAGQVQLLTKGGQDRSARLPRLRQALGALAVHDAWLDGEIVVLDASGRPDFGALQNAFDSRSTTDIILFVFDLLWLDGIDLSPRPLSERRRALDALIRPVESRLLRLSDIFRTTRNRCSPLHDSCISKASWASMRTRPTGQVAARTGSSSSVPCARSS